jgi:hypothetical protein
MEVNITFIGWVGLMEDKAYSDQIWLPIGTGKTSCPHKPFFVGLCGHLKPFLRGSCPYKPMEDKAYPGWIRLPIRMRKIMTTNPPFFVGFPLSSVGPWLT